MELVQMMQQLRLARLLRLSPAHAARLLVVCLALLLVVSKFASASAVVGHSDMAGAGTSGQVAQRHCVHADPAAAIALSGHPGAGHPDCRRCAGHACRCPQAGLALFMSWPSSVTADESIARFARAAFAVTTLSLEPR